VSRVILTTAVVAIPTGQSHPLRLDRGQAVADIAANAIAGDTVCFAIAGAPSPVNCAPLDAAASAAMNGQAITTLAAIAANPGIGGSEWVSHSVRAFDPHPA
jgi:hypothetical protein